MYKVHQLDSLLFSLEPMVCSTWRLLVGDPVELSAVITRPSFSLFFCFILLFWNQIFTCVSFSCKAEAISILLALVKYLLKWNSFSNSVSCLLVKFVLPVLFKFRRELANNELDWRLMHGERLPPTWTSMELWGMPWAPAKSDREVEVNFGTEKEKI